MKIVTPVIMAAIVVLSMGAVGTVGTETLTTNSSQTEITECTVIDEPGHYLLADNLTMTADQSPCILINSSDVVLDGDGHSIEAESRTKFQETMIANFEGEGVDQVYSNITVENVHIRNADKGIDLLSVNESTVRDNTITMSDTEEGIEVRKSINVDISNNTIDGDGSRGITISDSDKVTIKNNRVREIGVGMALGDSSNVSVSQNTLTGLVGTGIGMSSRNVTVSDNLIRNNTHGLSVNGVGEVRIESNTIIENTEGIALSGGLENITVHQNTIQNNTEFGIVGGSAEVAGTVNATNNYWGAANGPSSPPIPEAPLEDFVTGTLADGDGDRVGELHNGTCPAPEGVSIVHFDPWLNQSVTNASVDGAS